jgi:hypothetical protein
MKRLDKKTLTFLGMSVALCWTSAASAGQWVRATTVIGEDIAMDYVGQRTLAVGSMGLTNQPDALWVLGYRKDYTNQNHYMYVWQGQSWSTENQTAWGAAMALGGGESNDYPYVIPYSGAVYQWNGAGGWYQYLPPGTANPLGFIQVSSWFGNLYFSQAGNYCDGYTTPCIDEYNTFGARQDPARPGAYWVGQDVSGPLGTGSGSLYPGTSGPYRLAIDPAYDDGSHQLKIDWDNGPSYGGALSVSTNGGRDWQGCSNLDYNSTPILFDVCSYNGTYYGIEYGTDSSGRVTHTVTTTSQGCTTGWHNLSGPNGVADTSPVYAIACDVSNGTLYSTQLQTDSDGSSHYRVFKWLP